MRTFLLAIAVTLSVSAFSQEHTKGYLNSKDWNTCAGMQKEEQMKAKNTATDTTKKDTVNAAGTSGTVTSPVRVYAIIIREDDLKVLSAFLRRAIDQAKGDPINTLDDIKVHNALPGLHDYLLKNIIPIDNQSPIPPPADKKKGKK